MLFGPSNSFRAQGASVPQSFQFRTLSGSAAKLDVAPATKATAAAARSLNVARRGFEANIVLVAVPFAGLGQTKAHFALLVYESAYILRQPHTMSRRHGARSA